MKYFFIYVLLHLTIFAQGQPDAVKEIRKQYYKFSDDEAACYKEVDNCKIYKITMRDDMYSDNLDISFSVNLDGNILIKVEDTNVYTNFDNSHQKFVDKTEYFFHKDHLVFCYMIDDGQSPAEYRYYFEDNALVRYTSREDGQDTNSIIDDKKILADIDIEYHQKRAQELMKIYKVFAGLK